MAHNLQSQIFKYWSDQFVPISIYKSNQGSLLVEHSLSCYFSVISSGTGLKELCILIPYQNNKVMQSYQIKILKLGISINFFQIQHLFIYLFLICTILKTFWSHKISLVLSFTSTLLLYTLLVTFVQYNLQLCLSRFFTEWSWWSDHHKTWNDL